MQQSDFVQYTVSVYACLNLLEQKVIEIDGGIGGKTAPLVVEQGANMLVAGTSVFRAEDASAAVQLLHDTQKLLPDQNRK